MKNKQFYYKNNRFQQLRGFYFSAKMGNVSKAAELMKLSQPSISLQIQALETDLDCKLFDRKGPSIRLTREGQVLMELIRPLVEGIDSLKENFSLLTKQLTHNQLNIAANQATMLYLLPRILRKYRDEYPDIKVKVHGAIALNSIEKLRNGEVDIIVGPPSFDIPEDCIYQPVFYYDPVLITRPEHPLAGKKQITLEEMSKYQLILPPPHLRTIKSMDEVFIHNNFQPPEVMLEFDGWELIKKYVELDMAITIALSIAIEDDPLLVGTPLNHYFPRSSYGIILRRGQLLPKQVQDFIDIMQPVEATENELCIA